MKASLLYLNKVMITSSLALILVISPTSHARSNQNDLIAIDTYQQDIKQALALYQAKDFTKALPALEEIAKRGDKRAQYIVGTMYLNSQGTAQDLKKSYAWLTVANEQKTKAWKKPLQMLDEKLPADFLALANQEAADYVEKYGAKAQKLKCRPVKTLGSKKAKHTCVKSELKPGFYFLAQRS
ncbi:sel1 repeat family protein [Thalassotalea euphylliae]|uniref:Sel1 repeat family protein n=1 Tax=Thalassotalea euphylliae TaxID=1655234 RepID=A0A3E0UJE0_9GAMM|nr:sel1 repeat family protein [Thalassotalea euphylliae]REL36986.1 sel1 repeat family protein [Thalassotalea euphylliae]